MQKKGLGSDNWVTHARVQYEVTTGGCELCGRRGSLSSCIKSLGWPWRLTKAGEWHSNILWCLLTSVTGVWCMQQSSQEQPHLSFSNCSIQTRKEEYSRQRTRAGAHGAWAHRHIICCMPAIALCMWELNEINPRESVILGKICVSRRVHPINSQGSRLTWALASSLTVAWTLFYKSIAKFIWMLY